MSFSQTQNHENIFDNEPECIIPHSTVKNYYSNLKISGTKHFGEIMDLNDPLKASINEYLIPKNTLYFSSGAVGPLPKSTIKNLNLELSNWGKLGKYVDLQEDSPWVNYEGKCESLLCDLLGCKMNEVGLMNGLSVNMNLLFYTFYRPKITGKHKILVESIAFSSDHFIVRKHIELNNLSVEDSLIELESSKGVNYIKTKDILKTIEENKDTLALVFLGAVQWYSGQYFELEKISQLCHKYGILFGLDLAHALGNVPLQLHKWNIDFAVFLSYKYLSSGIGSIGGIFIHEKYHNDKKLLSKRFVGWWGQDIENVKVLNAKQIIPKKGASSFKITCPSILNLVTLFSSLCIYKKYGGIKNFRLKSVILTQYFEQIIKNNKILRQFVDIITPSDINQRGSHLAFKIYDSYNSGSGNNINYQLIFDQFFTHKIICDYKQPNMFRISLNPVIHSFSNIWKFSSILESIIRKVTESKSKL